MLEFKKIQTSEILSETSYFTVKELLPEGALLLDSYGNECEVGEEYLKNIMCSADQFKTEEKINQSEMIARLLENPRTACSVYFQKQDKSKTKKVYLAEVTAQAETVKQEFLDKGSVAIIEALKNPTSETIPGEMRLIKGYHNGTQDARGRIDFIDMEDEDKLKAVDPRKLVYVIVNNIKYTLKK